jgi:VCBS repeat-containing protein
MKKTSPAKTIVATAPSNTATPKLRRRAGLMALEQRFMFDGAAASDVLQVTEYFTSFADIPVNEILASAEVHVESASVEPSLIDPQFTNVSDPIATQLNEAIFQAESGVRNFLTTDSAIQNLMSVYGDGTDSANSELQTKLEALRQDVLTNGLDVQLKLLDSVSLKGALGAFSAFTPDGQWTIYLNRDWLEGGASSDLLNRVLTEEIGHALDELLRPQLDAVGDEGKRFVQLVVGDSPDSQEFIKNDHFQIDVEGQLIEAEAAFPVYDVEFKPLGFGSGSRVSGTAGAVGETHLYSNVFTSASGQRIDAVVSLTALTGASLSAFDSTTNPYATSASFQPNLTLSSVGGFAIFNFSFILSGTYQSSSNPGSAVDLRNVIVNSYDLDGSGSSASGRQFTDFSGIGGYTLSTSSQIVVSEPSAGVTRFQTTIGGNITSAPGTTAGDNIRVRVTFDQLSTISVKVGDAGATGLAYFGIDFSEGATFTNAKVADIAVVTNGSVVTSEGGTTDSFTVALQSAPTANVTVTLTGLDATEGTLSANTLTFTPTNWNTPQTVTVTGVDDSPVDGDIRYTLTATATSTDIAYKGRTAVVDVVNTDDDVPTPLTVNNITVNESSPYGVFEVSADPDTLVTLALATGSAPAATGGGTDYSAAAGSGLQYLVGSTWTNYTANASVSVGATGKLLVRTAIVNDGVADNSETFKLNATDAGATTATGIATIKDDGTGTIFKTDGTDDTTAVRDDDRALAVNSITVNEASPYAVFEVTGAVNQLTKLALANGSAPLATGTGTDFSSATGTGLQYLVGSTWTSYTANANVSLGATGKLLVRTAIVNDSVADNSETFKLNATNTGGVVASGLATIKDDGTGTIFKDDGTDDTAAVRDDDRALAVNSIAVNEASPYAVFEVTGAVNQLAKLTLANGAITPATGGGTDYSTASGTGLQYLVGSTWTAYTAGADVSLGASGKLLVRTAIVNDTVADNNETFRLSASNLSGTSALGVATIKDDGTGTIFKNDGTDDTAVVRDDDRALTVNSITVNEASPYAVFEVTGAVNQLAKLALANGSSPLATGGGVDYANNTATVLQYLVGSTWTDYTANSNVSLGVNGKLFVRTAIVNDAVADNSETFKLNAANTGSLTAFGVATIKDDGTGDIFKDDTTKDLTARKDDDRALAVNNITVNEASPYAVFEVTGAANQLTSLALAAGTTTPASGAGVDYGTASGSGLEYWTGSAWSAYTSGYFALNGSGVLLVRTPIINDAPVDNNETFKLNASNTGGAAATGVATIKDDGTGNVYRPDGTVDQTATKDNDAYVALPTVNNVTVNEASPYAVLQVSGQLGQMVTLSLETGSATATADYTASMEYSTNGGASWTAYSTAVALNGAGGTLLVRVPVLQDTPNEPDETFVLKVTTTANTFAAGTVTIVDDGNGVIFNADGSENTTTVKDDDRVITITSPDVNEGSPSAFFVLTGAAGQNGFIYDGSTLIHSFTFGDTGSYGFFYSYTAEQETAVDGPEAKTLTVKTQSGTTSTGTATIKDDGSGSYWEAGNATPLTSAQLIAADVALDDDRVVSVNSISVNEASPYAVFTVSGEAGQRVSLALANSSPITAIGAGTDYSQSTGAVLQYFDGANWVDYTAGTAGPGAGTGKYEGTVALDATGSLLVRTRIVNDAIDDNNETFKLNVTNTGGVTTAGVATIKDDGTGTIFKNDGTDDSTALRDDDRPVTVAGTTVNEASSHVLFTVTGLAGQKVQLSLTESGSGNGYAVIGTDTGLASQLEYLVGTTWTSYTGDYLTLPAGGDLLVRVAVKNDTLNEGAETLKLIASTTGVSSNGLSTIKDDGTGTIYKVDGTEDTTTLPDDDRPLTIADITVAESVVGGKAVFNVNGFGGQYVKLALIAGTATSADDFGAAIQYHNGTTWVDYTPNALIQIPGSAGVAAVLQVRTAVVRDSIAEPVEQFRLVVTNTGGSEGRGTASITDNVKPTLSADTAIAVEQGGSANATAGVNPAGNFVAGTVVSGNLGGGGVDSDADGDTLTVASVANTAVSATAVATPTASAVNLQGLFGVLSVNNAGAYNYTVTNTNADVQALRSSADTLTETFTYKVSDGWGGESTSTLTVTISGANDAPVAVADFNVAKESLAGTIVGTTDYRNVTAYSTSSGATYDALGYKATGSVLPNDTDVDGNDTRTVLDAKVTGAGSATTVTSSGVTLTGTHGDLVIRADGTYTYTPTANSTALSEGQSANDVFVYTLQDAAGQTSTANLTITVYGSGSNDPDAVDDTNTVVEAGGSTSAVAATGNVLGGTGFSAGDRADTTPTGTNPLVVSDARSTSASTFTAVTTSTVINGQYGV